MAIQQAHTMSSTLPAFLFNLFDQLHEGIIILSDSADVLYINGKAAQLFRGIALHNQKHLGDLFHELVIMKESQSGHRFGVRDCLREGVEIKQAAASYRTATGLSGTLSLSLSRLKHNTIEDERWVFSFIDVTESLRDKLHRSRFVRAVGHELKHPLSSLKAYLYLINKRLKDVHPKTLEYLNQAEDQITILTTMLNDLTDISKITLQEFDVDPELQPILPVVKHVVADFLVIHPDRKITLEPRRISLKVNLDAIRVRQVLNNVLVNAAKYSEPGTPIEIKIEKNSHFADISIQDHGAGISEEDVQKIFEPYFRTKHGYQYKGLGLGLYISKEIMDRHHGEIIVKSKKDVGTKITLRFLI